MSLPPGSRIGRYEVLDRLGSGGMGVVYKARDSVLDRVVAVKMLPPEFATNSDRLRRFELEARVTGRLNHPHIVSIFDAVLDGPQPYLVTELLDGETLGTRLSNGTLPLQAALTMTRQVARALGAAHAQGVVHRDLKPDNILITREGSAKVLDFGLAKVVEPLIAADTPSGGPRPTAAATATTPGVTLGTLGYMAPEQVDGRPVDHRADIFSLGIVLYEALSGQQPFRRQSVVDTLHAILHDEPAELPPHVPRGVQQIVARCLQKQPDARFQSARDLEFALATVNSDDGTDRRPFAHRRLTRRAGLALAVGSAVLLVTAAVLLLRRDPAIDVASPSIRSIAVLPLEDISEGTRQEYLADSLTEALIMDLSQIRALRVIARTSVMRYKGTTRPLQDVARELGVTGIVEGTVLRVGDRVRVSASLVHAPTQRHIWGEQYDREFRDALALQSELAGTIAERIAVQLTSQERARLTATAAPEARSSSDESYLRGRYFWNKRDPASLQLALQAFEDATRADPRSARAWAGLADTYFYLGYAFGRMPPAEAMPKAREAALKALAIDPDMPEAHTALGMVQLFFDWDLAAAEVSLRRALRSNPGYVFAHRAIAALLLTARKPREAVEQSRQAVRLDPVSLAEHYFLGLCYLAADDIDGAERTFRRALELEPRDGRSIDGIGRVHEARGETDRAVEKYLEASAGAPAARVTALSSAYKRGGMKAFHEMAAALDATDWDGWHFSAFVIAANYAKAGRRDASFLWLKRAREARSAGIMLANGSREFDEYRTDERFRALLGPAFTEAR